MVCTQALDKNDSMLPDPVEFDAEDESLLSVMAVMIAEVWRPSLPALLSLSCVVCCRI